MTPRERLSFRDLLRQAERRAALLAEIGIGRTDRVATLLDAGKEWVVMCYALARLGAWPTPFNTRLQPAELRDALTWSRATAVVVQEHIGRHEFMPRLVEACPELATAQAGRLNSETIAGLRLALYAGVDGRRFPHLLDLAKQEADQDRQPHPSETVCPVAPDDIAAVIFTSGSSGRPKGAMLTHRNLIGHAHHLSRELEIGPGDRYLNLLPFFHIAGFAQSVVMNHYAGSTLVLPDQFDPDELLATIAREGITATAGMPVTIQRLLDRVQETPDKLATLRAIHGVSPELLERVWRETRAVLLTRMYGLSESSGLVSMTRILPGGPGETASCVGRPLPGVAIRIVDPDTGRELESPQAGEVTFSGWNRFAGYLDEPELTAAAVDRDGYFHTGDRGFQDEAGYLHFLGRFKEIVKTGGENVSQLEVERFLKTQVPGIKTVAVIGIPDEVWGEAVTAVIEPEAGAQLAADTVHEHCRGALASFKHPKHVLWLPAGGWPLSKTGKIDKAALKSWVCQELGIASHKKE